MSDWDLYFFKNKIIPSSSDEENPHLLSDDSEEEKLYKKPFSNIIRDVGNEYYDKIHRKIIEEYKERETIMRQQSVIAKQSLMEERLSSVVEGRVKSESKIMIRSESVRESGQIPIQETKASVTAESEGKPKRRSMRKIVSEWSVSSASSAVSMSPQLVKEPEASPQEISWIEESTFLGKKAVYSIKLPKSKCEAAPPLPRRKEQEIFHIAPIHLSPEIQRELKCVSGEDLLLEQPWGIISRSDVIREVNRSPSSPFAKYAQQLQDYPDEEMLIGRSDEVNQDEFVVALTLHGRDTLLRELREKHRSRVEAILRSESLPPQPWLSLGSDLELPASALLLRRPFISFDCTIKPEVHTKRLLQGFSCSEFYSEITEKKKVETIEALVLDKSIQAGPTTMDIMIQTCPEIPVNSTTQFSIEMRVEENEEILRNMEIDPEYLDSRVNSLLQSIEPHISYNEDFDIYQDDYEILAQTGEKLDVTPTLHYEYLSTMFTFLGTHKKGISGSSWHPNRPGLIAVAYAEDNLSMVGELEGDSDEEGDPEPCESDDEAEFGRVVTRSPLEHVLSEVWSSQLEELEAEARRGRREVALSQLASVSLHFIKYARDMRLFQMIQAKKQFINIEDFPDLDEEETFEYPLFDGTGHKTKDKEDVNMDEILARKSFLKRDYLFSDSFKWKMKGAESLNPIYMMMKEEKKVPKKYIRTFLFREFWSGDEWNFGSDLELQAIDVNRDFREAGLFALGAPMIPKQKIFLPGFNFDESDDPAEKIPWEAIEPTEGASLESPSWSSSELEAEEEPESGGKLFEKLPRCQLKLLVVRLRGDATAGELAGGASCAREEVAPRPRIVHVSDAYLSNLPWGFNAETQDFLLNEVKDIATSDEKLLFENDIEVLSEGSDFDYWENDADIDDLEKLNLLHYAVVWSINDILRPVARLSCPFEITTVSFCPHDGGLVAGGTSTGQVVLWEVSDWSGPGAVGGMRLSQPDHEEGFHHLRKVMSWFKRLSKLISIPISCLSSKGMSHKDRVIDITWLPPNIKVNLTGGLYQKVEVASEEEEEGEGREPVSSLQFISSSVDGSLLYWDLRGEPGPPPKASYSVNSLHRGTNFPPPRALRLPASRFSQLYLRWLPLLKVTLAIPHPQVTAVKYHVTVISHDEVPSTYEKNETDENRNDLKNKKLPSDSENNETYKLSPDENPNLRPEALIGTIDGVVALIIWQDPEEEPSKIGPEGLTSKVVRTYNLIHDGPIMKISRHPKKKDVFLSAGGHVFALWTQDRVDPLKWKKYPDLLVSYVGWTSFKASTFRVGFSDGSFEVWDLLEGGNTAVMRQAVGQGSIADLTIPRLPEPRGLVGIADQKGLLKFYNVPGDYRKDDSESEKTFFDKITREKSRKTVLSEMAEKERSELARKSGAGGAKREGRGEEEEGAGLQETEELPEGREARLKEVVGCTKYKEEMYKWYLRRRGRAAEWLDPAEKEWYKKEEDHMIQTILKNKKVSMKTLEKALVPLKEKEKRETELAVKKEEIVKMADKIFQKAIEDLQVVLDEVSTSDLETEKEASSKIEEVLKKVKKYFGESYEKEYTKLENQVKMHVIDESLTFGDILERNQKVRDFWNDRRRYLSKDQRWLREVVSEELQKEGLKFSYWIDHEESYKVKKYKRRLEILDKLKQVYGSDYDPFWDLETDEPKPVQKSTTENLKNPRHVISRLLEILVSLDPSVKTLQLKLENSTDKDLHEIDNRLLRKMVKYYINFIKEGGVRVSSRMHKDFKNVIKESLSTDEDMKVKIKIPAGSFFKKYARDSQQKWTKPKKTEDIFRTSVFNFKYGDAYPQPEDEELSTPAVICGDLVKPVKEKPVLRETTEEEEAQSLPGSEPRGSEIRASEVKGSVDARESSRKSEIADVEDSKSDEGKFEEDRKSERPAEFEQVEEPEESGKEEELESGERAVSVSRQKKISFQLKDQESGEGAGMEELGKEKRKGEEEEGEPPDMSEAAKKQIDIRTLYEIVLEKKAKGEKIMNLEELSSYESIESLDSISSLAESPDQSISSEAEEGETAGGAGGWLEETQLELKEHFEGPPPRYEPPRRRPYFRAPQEDEPTEEWRSEEKSQNFSAKHS